jgi:nucleotidyltransferase/DNA polymerase involved in DNA repair
MSVLYCTIPYFAAALARRDDPGLEGRPLVLMGPERRVFGVSAEAAADGVGAGMTARAAEVHCPEALLLDANVARCREEVETFLQLLEQTGPNVEPHGWGAAYVDLGPLVRNHPDAVVFCREAGQAVRRELGQALQPALGWDSSKFTAQAAALSAQPGRLRAVAAVQEQSFLRPLPVILLPLGEDMLLRLRFLGLRTLGQYAALPSAAVWQQFGRAGKLAHRCARGKDDRPVIPRGQALHLAAESDFETPLVERERLLAVLRRLVSPLLAELRGNLQACGQVRLTVYFDDGSVLEGERTFLSPAADEGRVVRTLEGLLDGMHGRAAPSASLPSAALPAHSLPSHSLGTGGTGRTGPSLALPSATLGTGRTGRTGPVRSRRTGTTALSVALEQIQDIVAEQLTLFPLEDEREGKLREVQRYLAARFGANHLRRAVLAQPAAPLPEWRVDWRTGDEP